MGNGRNGDELPQGELTDYCASTLDTEPMVQISKLVTMDENKTVIAKFHKARCCFRKRKARLEVHPAGMGMLDHIILTFVFAEQKRREREQAAKSGG
jgi:hypothetical protein